MNFTKKPTDGEFNEVFYNRKRIGSYKSIPLEIKKELMDYFLKLLQTLSDKYKLPALQIQNWFKYQRNRDYYHEQKVMKSYRIKHKFEKHERVILENAFRENPHLERKTLNILKKKLKCKESFITRWFSYRKNKLEKIKEKTGNDANDSHNTEHVENNTSIDPIQNTLNTTFQSLIPEIKEEHKELNRQIEDNSLNNALLSESTPTINLNCFLNQNNQNNANIPTFWNQNLMLQQYSNFMNMMNLMNFYIAGQQQQNAWSNLLNNFKQNNGMPSNLNNNEAASYANYGKNMSFFSNNQNKFC